jgi:hypothetical protein
MRYVLDSNVGVKWRPEEDPSDKARVVRDEFVQGLHQLLAPDVFMVEAAHALNRAHRQGRLMPDELRRLKRDDDELERTVETTVESLVPSGYAKDGRKRCRSRIRTRLRS